MKVGGAVIFQNPFDKRSDREVYEHDLRIGDMYEELGFDSIGSIEHHFDDYTMCHTAIVNYQPFNAAVGGPLRMRARMERHFPL